MTIHAKRGEPIIAKKTASPTPAANKRRGLPPIIWVWLGITIFWLMVSGINRLSPSLKTPAAATSTSALTGYFNDETKLFSVSQAAQLGNALAVFENETSNQIVVAVYPRVPHDAIEQFTIETAERSRLGRKGLDNGAILFMFMAERVARFEIGYGLEAALTDADARRILETHLLPAFAKGNYVEGIDGTLAATFKNVKDAYRANKMPGTLAVYWLQLKVKIPKLVDQAWPTLTALEIEKRVGITLFAGLLGIGIWDGFRQSARVGRNLLRGAGNLAAGRAFTAGMEGVGLESIIDTLKVFGLLLGVIIGAAGLVIVAAGGTFGGAGAQIHW
ncbi:MAG: TPM domain-containing protein [Burkholderiales bacterium]|nr:TPM domain-containing protein [Burkholderiales bacterium]